MTHTGITACWPDEIQTARYAPARSEEVSSIRRSSLNFNAVGQTIEGGIPATPRANGIQGQTFTREWTRTNRREPTT
jgi:hypothetical protein